MQVRNDRAQTRLPSALNAFVVGMLFFSCASTMADPDVTDNSQDSDSLFSSVATEGILFLNGHGVAGPYRIEADAQSITVNGLPIPSHLGLPDESDEEDDDETYGYAGLSNGPRAIPEDSHGKRGRFRRIRMGHRPHQHQPVRLTRNHSQTRESGPVHEARTLAEFLDSDYIVVLFDASPAQFISGAADEQLFCEAVLNDQPADDQIEEFAGLAGPGADRNQWRTMVREYVPDEQLASVMKARVAATVALEAQNRRQIDAVTRMNTFGYPLTLVGMLLGVLAFGHMLQWSGKGITATPGSDGSSETARHVQVAVLLMLGMSVLDLVWTILAGQAGVMREVNPVAQRYLDSPMQLATFKVVATVIGLGILYAWRRRQQMQQATWWMCLVCVLLTFRWVMFDSMMS